MRITVRCQHSPASTEIHAHPFATMHVRTTAAFAACALMTAAAHSTEPPELPALSCTVVEQEVAGGMRLKVKLENRGAVDIELPPGPYLVFFDDRSATDAMEETARMDRVQKSPITVQPGAARVELFAVSEAHTQALRCNGRKPVATAMYFYRFSQRPQFRCLLGNYDLEALTVKPDCPRNDPLARSGRP